VLGAQAEAARGTERADLLERLAAHLERAGDRDGAAEALARALEADPHRDATWSWLLMLAPEDEERLARAETARRRAETEVTFASSEAVEAPAWQAPALAAGGASVLEAADAPAPEQPPVDGLLRELLAPAPEDARAASEPATAVAFETQPPEAGRPFEPETAIAFEAQAPGAAHPFEPETVLALELSPPPEAPAAPPEVAFEEPPEGAAPGETEPEVAAISFEAPAEGEPGFEVEAHLPLITDLAELARDGRLRMEAGDFEGAYERLALALARDPSDLTVARDLSRVTERLGLFDEYVQLGEVCAEAISGYDPLAAAARFRHFAEVLRDRLGEAERAAVMLEKSLALVPDDPDTRRELVQLLASRPETAPRALDIWLDLARRDPSDGEASAGVAEVCARLAEASPPEAALHLAERGRLAASLAAFVAPATFAPPPPGKLAAQVALELRARVAAPGATGPLARLLRLLAPFLEPLFPADLQRRGVSPADRIDAARFPALAVALDGAARALWARPHSAFLSTRPGLEMVLENTRPPAVIATAGVAELPTLALSFLSARALDLLDHGWALVGKFAPKDIGILLELACRFAGASPPSLGLPAERAGAFLKVLEAQVPAAARAAASELAAPSAEELAETDPRAFAAALRRTANRVALLYAGEPGAALHALALLDRRLEAGSLDPVQALALPDLRDLALFSLSDPFVDLRAALVR